MSLPKAILASLLPFVVVLLLGPNNATAGSTTFMEANGSQPMVVSPNGRNHLLYDESHALLISVGEYSSTAKGGWERLANTKSEVDAVAQALRQHGFSITRVIDPTSEELHSAFRQFLARHGQKNNIRLVVFFSGHGYTNPLNDFGYVVPVDAKNPSKNPVDFYSKALPIQQVDLWAREVVAKHVLFMFDSCFSGSMFSTKSESIHPDVLGSDASARWRFLQGKSQEPVRQFISAGGPNELLPARSDFVPMLLNALRYGLPQQKDGFFTGKGLGLWLEETLPSLTGGKQNPQSGVVRSPALAFGDMVFQITALDVQQQEPMQQAKTKAQPGKKADVYKLAKVEQQKTSSASAQTFVPSKLPKKWFLSNYVGRYCSVGVPQLERATDGLLNGCYTTMEECQSALGSNICEKRPDEIHCWHGSDGLPWCFRSFKECAENLADARKWDETTKFSPNCKTFLPGDA